jgi:hypothetical protein
MNRILFAAAAAALGLGLAACETATPYQPAPPGSSHYAYGYRDSQLDASHWRVSFAGNSLTSRETVEKYLLFRAAELTVQQGADWFEAAERHTERNTSYWGTSDPFYASPFWATYGWGWRPYWGFGGPWGWRTWDPWGGPYWGSSINIDQINRYEASAEIVMGKGPPPQGQRVFNAHEVVQNLGPQIVRPKA